MKNSVLIMAGGTGGHVFPALAVAQELTRQGMDVHWLGTAKGIENDLVPRAGFPLHFLTISGLRGKGLAGLFSAPWRITKAIIQARKIIKKIQPVAVLGFGGYATGPGGVAARLAAVPLLIHEQNAIAGMTNKLLAPLSQVVMQAFPHALSGAITVGNPVREEVVNIAQPAVRFAQRMHSTQPLQVLVVGGSLGAQALNQTVLSALAMLSEEQRPQIIHQVGKQHFSTMTQAYHEAKINAQVVPFIDDMANAYANADLIICRAGALTVSEVSAAGCAALFVPFPFAVDDHQTSNANYLVAEQAGLLLPQKELDAKKLAQLWQHYQAHREELLSIAERARALAQTQATNKVVQQIMRFCHD